jgi:CubicO group peptidase (beta-lactamase class C family)
LQTEAREPLLPWFGRKYFALLDRFALNIPMLGWKYCVSLLIPALVVSLSVHAQGKPPIKKEQVDKAIQELEILAQQAIQDNAVPGLAIAVVLHDKVVYAQGFGVREVGKSEPVTPDTVFQLASLSKPISATVVAALVGEGKISWDSKISDLDPTFAMYDPWVTREITIRDMYAHRSGLPKHAGDLLEDLGYDRAQVLYRLRFQKPKSSFRMNYAYTNFGLTEAAVAAAQACGLEWEDASEQKLYKRLGMNVTSSRFRDFMARANKALGHVWVDGNWVQKFQRQPDAQSPAGGVSSSVNDMAKWIRLKIANGKFGGEQIVKEKALVQMDHPHMLTGFNPLTGLPSFYGLGMNVSYDQEGRARLNHSGAFALGAATHVHMVPSEQLGIVILTNAYPVGVAEGLASTFIDLALYGKVTYDWLGLFKKMFSDPAAVGIAVGTDYSKPPASPSAPLNNDAYVGAYANDFFGDIEIVAKDDGLAIVEGPNKMTFALKHYDRDTFTYQTTGENAVGTTGVYFTIGADGKAKTVLVENLNVDKQGAFTRKPAPTDTSQD